VTSPSTTGQPPCALIKALAELQHDESYVLRSRYGIGDACVADETIAANLGVSVKEVWQIQAQALEALGFFLLANAGVFDRYEPAETW
jgi:DNA-directed RNA polymerase sigma subunit (sigma70/sigma32)